MSKRAKGILVELRERARFHRTTAPNGDTADLLDRAAREIERLSNRARERLLRAREAEGRKPPKEYHQEGERWTRIRNAD